VSSSGSSAGLAACPAGKSCCANPVEKRTEICPFQDGVCCDVGGDQDAGYCCPTGTKCISEHFNDGTQSGLNQFRITCMKRGGKVQLFNLPTASKTLTFEEERQLIANMEKAEVILNPGEVGGPGNPVGANAKLVSAIAKKRQMQEEKRQAKLLKLQKKLSINKVDLDRPAVITVLDNSNTIHKPRVVTPPKDVAPKMTQDEIDRILKGKGSYPTPIVAAPKTVVPGESAEGSEGSEDAAGTEGEKQADYSRSSEESSQ